MSIRNCTKYDNSNTLLKLCSFSPQLERLHDAGNDDDNDDDAFPQGDEPREDFSQLPIGQQKKQIRAKIDSLKAELAKEIAERCFIYIAVSFLFFNLLSFFHFPV